MGSYISIYNNTNDTYLVKVGPDEAALKAVLIVTSVIGAIAVAIATVGAGSGISATLVANGIIEVFGISTTSLAAITAAASSLAGYTIAADAVGWAVSMVKFITVKLQKDEGFVEIMPGEKKTFGKYTLSLWRQATCHRVRPNPENEAEVVMDVLYMRPIFSGATDGSVLEHNLQYWIDKWGHEEQTVVRMSPNSDIKGAEDLVGNYSSVSWVKIAEEAVAKQGQMSVV